MSGTFTEITPEITDWIQRQKMFFVSTAPLSEKGWINCSPKGLDTLRILGPRTLAYLDLTGSGVETIAHLKENGRIVIMLCAFDGPPQIMRFYGKGRVIERDCREFEELMIHFDPMLGMRSIIQVELTRISETCGFAVPLYEFKGHRPTLLEWSRKKGEEGVRAYQKEKNQTSLQGLPGLGG